MNRERQLAGPNSYTRELGFNPLDRLLAHLAPAQTPGDRERPPPGWLDLCCCGGGRALIQASEELHREGIADRVELVGVDWVDYFDAAVTPPLPVQLVCASILSWTPTRPFDLITCVHGLHYVGDKLAALVCAAGWLSNDGTLVADLDLASIRLPDGRAAGRTLSAALRRAGFIYHPRRRRITCTGRRDVSLPSPTSVPTTRPARTTPANQR